jgi:hypothetical protein
LLPTEEHLTKYELDKVGAIWTRKQLRAIESIREISIKLYKYMIKQTN